MNYNDNHLVDEARPNEGRPYDFNKGDERFHSAGRAAVRILQRTRERGLQTVRKSSPATLGGAPLFLVQDAES